MKENLAKSGDLIFSQRILLELVRHGLRRDEAYDLVQSIAGLAWDGRASFKDMVLKSEKLGALLDRGILESCFDISYHLKNVNRIYKRVLGE